MSIFNFPSSIDDFTPELFNDVTVVNADHVTDLRNAIIEVQKSLVGVTPIEYTSTQIIENEQNIQTALSALDLFTSSLASEIDFFFTGVDGYATRISTIEDTMAAHRSEQSDTDSDGYSVHGVDGFIVGTLDTQTLYNKHFDSGTNTVGPKIITRTSLVDAYAPGNQIEVHGLNGVVSSINYRGDAYFAGDIIVEGDRIIKGTDIVEQSLTVDGSSYLGNDSALDETRIKGNTNIEGTFTVTKDITGLGSNADLGDTTGNMGLNYQTVSLSNDAYIEGNTHVSGSTSFGDGSGETHTFKGSIFQSEGFLHTSGDFRAGGSKFRVENNTTIIDTAETHINSQHLRFGDTSLWDNGNITSDGYQYSFGEFSSRLSNTFVINANTIIEEELNVTGTIQSDALHTNSVRISGAQPGYILTATNNAGDATWQVSPNTDETNWFAPVDGYMIGDVDGYILPRQKLMIDTTDGYNTPLGLPMFPQPGEYFKVTDPTGSWAIEPLVLHRMNIAHQIDGSPADKTLSTSGTYEFVFYEPTQDWILV